MATILIVDDNPIQAVTRRLILERAHFHIAIADSGAAALARLDAGEKFGMIVTDHCMPVMDGPSLVRKLRERAIPAPIVVLSGLPEAEAEYEGLDVIFRMKPIPPEELIELARSLLFQPLDQTA